jgi:hypothetical protein
MTKYCNKMIKYISKITEHYIKMTYSKYKMIEYHNDGGLDVTTRGIEGLVNASINAG